MLFVLYIVLIVLLVLLKYFNDSLESVQRYHYRLLDYPWDNTSNQMLLRYCCLSSVIKQNPSVRIYCPVIKKIKLIQGLQRGAIETTGISFVKDRKMHLVFVSTSNLDDVLYGLLKCMTETKFGMVHGGYHTKFIEMYTSILYILHEQSGEFDSILCCGHSLGGVMASIAGLYLEGNFGYRTEVFTFGAPRWCNCQVKHYTSKRKNLKITNYINTADPITQHPRSSVFVTAGDNVFGRIDTKNDNVNHGIKVYREIVSGNTNYRVAARKHRIDEVISRIILDLFS
jgi:hypothetical protein